MDAIFEAYPEFASQEGVRTLVDIDHVSLVKKRETLVRLLLGAHPAVAPRGLPPADRMIRDIRGHAEPSTGLTNKGYGLMVRGGEGLCSARYLGATNAGVVERKSCSAAGR